MTTDLLHQKIQSLKSYPIFADKTETLGQFENILRESSDWQLFRINPLQFSKEHQLDAGLCVDLFVHAAKIGLFDFDWNMLCPGCGGIEYCVKSMDQIKANQFHCTICNIDVTTEADHQIEVAFTLNKGIKPLAVDPFQSFDTYRKYFFSANYERSHELHQYSASHFIKFVAIAPDAQQVITFQPEKHCLYRLLSMVSHSEMYLRVTDEVAQEPRTFEIDVGQNGFMVKELYIPSGTVSFVVHNRTPLMNATTLLKTDFKLLHHILEAFPNARHPFLTAKELLNNQSFRDLFRFREFSPDFSLNVKNLTILFTDLRGSTEMYEKFGDITAYKLVQKHFEFSIPVVRKHAGAVVKTIGDSIMATFSTPMNALRAAGDMIHRMTEITATSGEQCLGMRIGLHEGPAMVVLADERLDYFGQSVNIAARVKDLAQTGEVWLTDVIYDNENVRSLLNDQRISARKHSATLKGIGHPITLYQCAF